LSDLRELYQEVILDHNRRPRNFRAIDDASRKAEGYNPLCGDRLSLYLKVENGVITDASFQGSGCAISKASASMMTDSIKGRTLDDARRMFDEFHGMVTGKTGAAGDPERLGKLAVFEGVRDYPARVKCASLAWHTLRSAVDASDEVVSTEAEHDPVKEER
jgi:nitrogen fixation NifU-like protein